jgi:hypothetical protein
MDVHQLGEKGELFRYCVIIGGHCGTKVKEKVPPQAGGLCIFCNSLLNYFFLAAFFLAAFFLGAAFLAAFFLVAMVFRI